MKKQQLDIYTDYIQALTDISNAITSDLYIEDLLKFIVMVTAQVTGFAICSLWLINRDKKPPEILLRATQAISPEYVKNRSLGLNEGVVGYVATCKRPLIVKNVLLNRRFKEKEMAKELGLTSMAGIPLQTREEKIMGVLNCFTTTPHDFTETEVNLLTAVANQAAVAVLNTELMVKTKVIQEELEARKIIEQAKEILMHQKGFMGDEAYRWLQKKSMDSRKSMREFAEAILISNEIFKN